MSAVPLVVPGDLPASRTRAAAAPRRWVGVLSFALLALYGAERWERLTGAPPSARLIGLALLATALAGLVPLARHLTATAPRPLRAAATGALLVLFALAALLIAGLPLHWVVHVRVARSAQAIGNGLGALGGVLVPYLGHAFEIRLVITLGAAVLLIDAAVAYALAGPGAGDGRRALAALPLIALAIVPATLVRPSLPALQGLVLFLLLVAFMWGDRVAAEGRAAAAGVACAAGVLAVIAGPLLEGSKPWIDYRAWGTAPAASGIERFDWNQTYATLRWPQGGRVMLSVRATRGDYWEAEALSAFDGTAWVSAPAPAASAALLPSAAARARYTEPVTVTIDGLQSSEVIAGAGLSSRPQLAGGTRPGTVPGTWVARHPLTPGDAYTVESYAPDPSPRELAQPGAYPWGALAAALTLELPVARGRSSVTFPHFHAAVPASLRAALAGSPYERAFALARGLAARSPDPAAFTAAVKRYLDSGRYGYDQRVAPSRYPLLAFLFSRHVGYCQQFSGAMALLLRMGGLPARVGAGFTSGAFDPGTRTWTVSDVDAHAWDEVWFPRVGWVLEDPTPSADPALGGSGHSSAAATPRSTATAPDLRAQLARERALTRGRVPSTPRTGHVSTPAASGGRRGGHRGAGAGAWPWLLAAGLALVALLGALWWRGGGTALDVVLRRVGLARRAEPGAPRPARDPVAELERALARTGRPLAPTVTLAELERRYRDCPPAAAYVRELRLARYGPDGAAPSAAGRRALRAELAAGLGLRGRLRALWALPPRRPERAARGI